MGFHTKNKPISYTDFQGIYSIFLSIHPIPLSLVLIARCSCILPFLTYLFLSEYFLLAVNLGRETQESFYFVKKTPYCTTLQNDQIQLTSSSPLPIIGKNNQQAKET